MSRKHRQLNKYPYNSTHKNNLSLLPYVQTKEFIIIFSLILKEKYKIFLLAKPVRRHNSDEGNIFVWVHIFLLFNMMDPSTAVKVSFSLLRSSNPLMYQWTCTSSPLSSAASSKRSPKFDFTPARAISSDELLVKLVGAFPLVVAASWLHSSSKVSLWSCSWSPSDKILVLQTGHQLCCEFEWEIYY